MKITTKKLNIDLFKKVLQAPQNQLFQYLSGIVSNIYEDYEIGSDYILAVGDTPVLLVSHMDTVHEKRSMPKSIFHDPTSNVMWSPDGIGGDDRCGIFSILMLLANRKSKPSVLFTKDEEIGCLGAKSASRKIAKDIHSKFKFIVELDRRGQDDCVFYQCNNQEFIKYIETFGFVKNTGSCSDISQLCPSWDVAGVNLSIGYFNEHTQQEYINLDYMVKTINRVDNILESVDKDGVDKFDYGVSISQSAYYYKEEYYKNKYSNDPNYDPFM